MPSPHLVLLSADLPARQVLQIAHTVAVHPAAVLRLHLQPAQPFLIWKSLSNGICSTLICPTQATRKPRNLDVNVDSIFTRSGSGCQRDVQTTCHPVPTARSTKIPTCSKEHLRSPHRRLCREYGLRLHRTSYLKLFPRLQQESQPLLLGYHFFRACRLPHPLLVCIFRDRHIFTCINKSTRPCMLSIYN